VPGERGSERPFERERDWRQGPAKWAAVVVLGSACALTSAWVMTGRVPIEPRTGPPGIRLAQGAPAPAPGPALSPEPASALLTTADSQYGPWTDAPPETSVVVDPHPELRAGAPPSPASRETAPKEPAPVGRKVNINTATAAELELLPGVGPKMAERIIEHRKAHGAFKTVDALDGVSGIGPRILERLRPLVSVD
jgi:competence ComEA-like helix-hairpin-helix protein